MGAEVAVAGLIISAAGTAVSVVNQRKQAGIQKEQQAQQSASQDVASMEQRRRQIREQKVRQAQIEQASVNTGTEGSSGSGGAAGALATNAMTNVSFGSGSARTSNNISGLSQRSATIGANTALWEGIGSTGGSLFNASMSNKETSDKFYSLFD